MFNEDRPTPGLMGVGVVSIPGLNIKQINKYFEYKSREIYVFSINLSDIRILFYIISMPIPILPIARYALFVCLFICLSVPLLQLKPIEQRDSAR